MPFDYYTNRPANRGLAKAATIIRKIRQDHPDALLVDCGDTIQGSPMEDLHSHAVQKYSAPQEAGAERGPDPGPDPMIAAMNALDYDAMVVGNHEFNFGLDTMLRAKKEAEFPWLAANATAAANAQEAMAIHDRNFDAAYHSLEDRVLIPLIVNEINGVTVAVIGLTTPAVTSFEMPENIAAYRFESALESAREWVKYARQRRQADVVIIAAHMGLERGLDDPTPFPSQLPGENQIYEIAQKVPGIDAIIFGHTHQELAGKSINGVLLAQPKFWGQSVARLTITLERPEATGVDTPGPWKVVAKSSEVIPITGLVTSDPEIEAIGKPHHEAAQKYLDTPVAQNKTALETRFSRVMDTSALQAIHEVQLASGASGIKADVSLTAAFDTHLQIPAGPVTVRQLAALYPYENTLVIVEGTGQMLKDALEQSARYFLTYSGQPGSLIDRQVFGYNYDTASGAGGNFAYKVDLSKPAGQRIVDMKWKGAPLDMQQKLRLAINSYRKAGGGGYTMFRDAKVAWQSPVDIRQLMIQHYRERKTIDPSAAESWTIVPEAARQALLANPE
jgi:2',3'-cyclic-nucleotide 2'-phosphodiesterase/3'-nucleotidase